MLFLIFLTLDADLSGLAGLRVELVGAAAEVALDGRTVEPGKIHVTTPGAHSVTVRYHGPDDAARTDRFDVTLEAGSVKAVTLRIPDPPTATVRAAAETVPRS